MQNGRVINGDDVKKRIEKKYEIKYCKQKIPADTSAERG